MTRKPVAHLLLALTLAAVMPLELAQCGWMAIGNPANACTAGMPGACAMGAATASAGAPHACCRAKSHAAPAGAARRSGPASICVCNLLPAATLPAAPDPGAASASHVFVAALQGCDLPAPVSPSREILPAPDVGNAPLPAALGAHLLRAPPVSA
jgi:hypothetical protein